MQDIELFVEKHYVGDISSAEAAHSTYRLSYILKIRNVEIPLSSHELDTVMFVLAPHRGKEILTIEY